MVWLTLALIIFGLIVWFNTHQHHYTLMRWDNQEQCMYVQCWECGKKSYGDSKGE